MHQCREHRFSKAQCVICMDDIGSNTCLRYAHASFRHLSLVSLYCPTIMPLIRLGYTDSCSKAELVAFYLPKARFGCVPICGKITNFQCTQCTNEIFRMCTDRNEARLKQKVVAASLCPCADVHNSSKKARMFQNHDGGGPWLYRNGISLSDIHFAGPDADCDSST